jgi:hypothetical protein
MYSHKREEVTNNKYVVCSISMVSKDTRFPSDKAEFGLYVSEACFIDMNAY